jgi:cytochrome c biogenesis protein CcdA/thiol-disulfide isomerase/thioredoxin
MLLLVAFAIVAGAGTALTPCVLPVLPGLLSAAGTGGRRRPLGVIVGLAGTHTLAIVALATVIDGVGLPSGAVRTLSVVVLAGFGLLLLLPEAAARVEALLSRLVRVAPRSAGSGFWSGVVVGGGLGFVYAPCAGPILAAVVSVSATQGASGRLVAVALGYAAGSAVVLLAIAYGGRRVIDTLRRRGRGPAVQRSLGAVMLITAVAVGADLDVRFQTLLANHVPTFLTNPTHALERTGAVEDRLAGLRGRSRFDSASAGTAARTSKASSDGSSLPVLGHAPDFRDNERWFNTPGGRPLTLRALRGRVVLVDFWTYTCINCIRTLPALRAWDDRYRRAGLTIVGVHTPEFPFERDPRNVGDAIAQNRLRYPIAQDNAYGTWNAWGNQYWPAKYLIDGQGRVRYTHFGEGDYDVTERAIRSLLKEAGAHALGASADAHPEVPATGLATPETYLGTKRAQGWAGKPPTPGSGSYPVVTDLPDRAFALGGSWRVSGVRVFLDGRPVPSSEAGEDVHGGALIVRQQRLYRLVSLPRSQRRRLTLRFGLGVSGFAFTFG